MNTPVRVLRIVALEITRVGYRHGVTPDTNPTLADFLLPEGYRRPAVVAALREGSVVAEGARAAVRIADRRIRRGAAWATETPPRNADPVLLVPGFLAGDATLALMAKELRSQGLRTYRSHISCNAGCVLDQAAKLERRLERIALRRGSRVQVVGHSLGGMLARGLAVRRPDLVSNIVTLGSPMLAPGAHHLSLTIGVEVINRLSRAGLSGMMGEECVRGRCARESFEESRSPLPEGVGFTAVWSRRDGIVDWRSCIDPLARSVEVTASHVGMAVDPRVLDVVSQAVRPARGLASVVEVDSGVGA